MVKCDRRRLARVPMYIGARGSGIHQRPVPARYADSAAHSDRTNSLRSKQGAARLSQAGLLTRPGS